MSEKIIVTVNEGKIKGIKGSSKYSGAEFYSFFGVPYGQPPVSNFRFEDPVKVKPWKTTYDATREKPGCTQFSLKEYQMTGDEDCLFNNIHTPKLPSKNEPLKPVIVNIHPGGFLFGTPNGDHYGSTEFVMHHDTVYVTISYRIHIFGFLNLGLKKCSGNQGLKDLILSLEWIRDNIHSFSGDPDNVTVLGSSSGAAAVHFLMLSSSAKGLFHKAILMGSYALIPLVPSRDSNEIYAFKIAQRLGFEGKVSDKKQLLSFLKKQDAQLLTSHQRSLISEFQNDLVVAYPIGIFSPTVDYGIIFPQSPEKLLESMMRIPIMVGFCEKESVMAFTRGDVLRNTEANFKTSFCQNHWGWGGHMSDENIKLINKQVESFYVQGQPIEQAPLLTKIDILDDVVLSDLYDTLVNIIATELPSSAFVYKFSFDGEIISMKTAVLHTMPEYLKGAFHACDFSYWNCFSPPRDKPTQGMVDIMTKLFTSFARTGNPNYESLPVEWKPSTPDKPCYLDINETITLVNGKLNNERSEFWDGIKKQFKNN
ncbi:esterase E4-like [Planococcus citri]|uniref:esterase E4-like n=1 Tax=Planococcus citri TaxID=170843 RepID=UPI0031F96B1D